ncbi:hypothetical protein I6A80_003645 [Pseudomonas aeruginosa]|uniref:hypothetical protein n=1 Tax=Pseudomonas aeruginosa TaxID=287 RepID=UPI0018C2A650|nr:hypothetical protein [Pseudomonas aeruginosa]QPP31188.1 hypothetical protein I6A80_003645 [Pseudomonas aeruginosa]
MDIAKCVLDNQTYTAWDFSRLPPRELSTKRKHLVCIECQAVAFFRKASRNGQAACFGAFPHLPGCSLALSDTQDVRNKNVAHHLNEFVKFRSASALSSDISTELNVRKKECDAEDIIYSAEDLKPSRQIRRQLSATLKHLILNEKFSAPTQTVEVKNVAPTTANHFFVSFDEIGFDKGEELHGYWGMLTDARLSGEGALWLNSGGSSDVSCVIQAESVDEFFGRYNLEDEEDLAGAYVIVIGALKISSGGKKYIRLSDVDCIDVININLNRDVADQYFLTHRARIAFLLTHNQLGVFDEELGIKRKHYIDKNVAKAWRAKFASQFHPDKNQGDSSMDYDEILSCINKTYKRMVGEA